MALTPSLMRSPASAPPRLATPRDLTRATDGAAGALVAHMHGRPWVSWQREAADIIGELLPDGRYMYPTVVVLVPRQCGKTTFVFDLAIGRCLAYADYRAAYAAQTGHVTTERFGERIEHLERTALRRMARTRRSQGTERITAGRAGSYLKAFPPKSGALRSNALDLVVIDEAQEHDENLGRELDATIIPTFNTRPRRQLILIGTAGTARSGYLRRYLDEARAGTPGYALVEYGFPETADAADESIWQTWHPGLTAGLTDVDALRDARTRLGNDAAFLREFGNVWSVAHDVSPIDALAWTAGEVEPFAMPTGSVLAFETAMDRSESVIAAACRLPDGRDHIRLLESRPGAAWLPQRVEDLAHQLKAPVIFDQYGPALDTAQILTASRTGPRTLTGTGASDLAAACMGLAAAVNDGRCTHAGQAPLSAAAATATRRHIGDRWAFDRRVPGLPVAALIAAALARHDLANGPPRKKPVAAT